MNILCPELHQLILQAENANTLANEVLSNFIRGNSTIDDLNSSIKKYKNCLKDYELFCKTKVTVNDYPIWAPDYIALENLAKENNLDLEIITSNVTPECLDSKSLRLVALDLSNLNLKSITSLSGLSKLIELDLSFNYLRSVESLEELRSLKILNLDRNQLISIEPLKNLTDLEELGISDNLIFSLEPLREHNKLTNLGASNNQIKTIDPITSLKNLAALYLHRNLITSIINLKNLEKLTFLDLRENPIFPTEKEQLNSHFNSKTTIRYE